jgi:hypothetical protein
MLPGETIAFGCPVVWPNCEADVLPLAMLRSSSGHDINTRCPCGPSYSRESDYGPTRLLAKAALAGCCSFGGSSGACDAATCPPEQAQPSVTATSSLASQIRLAMKRTARHIAQLLTRRSTTKVVEDDTSRPSRSRRFNVTVLHNSGPGRFFGYEQGDALIRVFDLSVSASGVDAAAEVVFAVTNSYPGELFCEPSYADVVAEYRAAGLRSLSVGDVLIIADHTGVNTAWACAPAGFDQLDGLPTFTNSC